MVTPSQRVVQAIISRVKHQPSHSSVEDLDVPFLPPKYNSKLAAFSYGVTAVIITYGVFFMDFGKNRHCFSAIREQALSVLNSFINLQPDDQKLIEQRVKEMEMQVKQVTEHREKKQLLTKTNF